MRYLIIFSIFSLGTAEHVTETNLKNLNTDYDITQELLDQLVPNNYQNR